MFCYSVKTEHRVKENAACFAGCQISISYSFNSFLTDASIQRTQSSDLLCKSLDLFLSDRDLHERVTCRLHDRKFDFQAELTFRDCLQTSITEAVAQRCSVKKVFLEILQNSQEKTCASVSFLIALQASAGCRHWCRIFRNFQKLLFLQNTSHGCFYKVTHLIFFYNIFTLFQNCLWIVFPHLKNRI